MTDPTHPSHPSHPTNPSHPAFVHDPVMVEEVVAVLEPLPPGAVLDATVGGGGHARALLEARPDLRVLGIDRDDAALDAAAATLARYGERVALVRAGFDRLERVVEERVVEEPVAGSPATSGERASVHEPRGERASQEAGVERPPADPSAHPSLPGPVGGPVVGVLFDLGISSPQVDVAERGFSYQRSGPLDMRMDRSAPVTAADLVNDLPEPELARTLRRFGDERFARPIARAIVRRRPLHTTGDLVEAVEDGIPAAARRTGRHPARRTFQALRIAVNDELGQLERGLDAALAAVAPRGRIAVISYHSLEDRLVKDRFRDWATGGHHPPGLPVRETERGGVVRLLTRRPLRPTAGEAERNPRAESARLRAVEKLEAPGERAA